MLALAGIGSAGAAVCGDADGDDAVTTSDAVRILSVAAGGDPCASDGCDVDRDGSVSVTDGVLALRRAAGLAIVDHCGTGTITGRLLVLPAATASTTLEREPNDGPGTAAALGRLAPGDVRRFTGSVGSDDPYDGYAFVADGALALELTLTFPVASDTDLDLLVDDRRGGAVTCESAAPAYEHCRVTIVSAEPGAFDVVVTAATESPPAAYVLTVSAARGAGPPGVAAGPGAGPPLEIEPAVYRGETAPIATGEIVMRMAPRAANTTRHSAGTVSRRALAAAGVADAIEPTVTAPDGSVLLILPAATASAVATAVDPASLAAKQARGAARGRTREVAAALAANPGVLTAEPNYLVRAARAPRDPLFSEQWHFDVIGLPEAWDVTIGSPRAIVAVIDTGIRSDHPDLVGRLVAGFDFISNPTRANDGDGLDPDPFDPGDDPRAPAGGTFHGTHVAGTIGAATDNPFGVAGVTWRTAVMPLRVLGVGGGTVFDVAQAIRYAAGLANASGEVPPVAARIVNLSLTTSGDDPVLRTAVDAATDAGVLVIAAAGNTGHDGFLSPAGFSNVLSVAATDRLGVPARYSSFGAAVDVAAPGGDTHRDRDADDRPDGILSTLLPGRTDYGFLQGTSMASAHVSGVAALLLGVPGGASAARLREVLLATADDRGAPGRDDHYGAGIVDAARAVRTLAGLTAPAEPRLVLETATLRVAADESAPRVFFRNAGGGTLVVAPPEVATEDGGDWLAASVEDAALRIAVDRDALPAGVYAGRVGVASNGGPAELVVVAEVAASPPEDLGLVKILLRDLASRSIVATTTSEAGADYHYRLDGVPPGRYEILATTDRDGDGETCDVGEECGAYPERTAPTVVTIFGGATVRARDFGLSFVLSASDPAP